MLSTVSLLGKYTFSLFHCLFLCDFDVFSMRWPVFSPSISNMRRFLVDSDMA